MLLNPEQYQRLFLWDLWFFLFGNFPRSILLSKAASLQSRHGVRRSIAARLLKRVSYSRRPPVEAAAVQ
jgi:hypothetical protein